MEVFVFSENIEKDIVCISTSFEKGFKYFCEKCKNYMVYNSFDGNILYLFIYQEELKNQNIKINFENFENYFDDFTCQKINLIK